MSTITNSYNVIKNNYFDGLKVTKRHLFLFAIIASSYFFEQFDNANFGYISPSFMASMKVSPQVLANITSLYYMGMTLGGMTGGIISDIIGRRKTLLLSMFLFSAGSVLTGLATDVTLFTMARTVTGFGVMCMMVVTIAYMAELSPKESRGKWEALIAGIGYISIPLVGVICRAVVPLHPNAWRYILFLGGLGLVAWVLGLIYLKESPRWLVSKGRVTEAEEVIYSLTGTHVDLSDVNSAVKERSQLTKVVAEMFSPLYLKRTIILLVTLCSSVVSAQILAPWMTTLLKMTGYTTQDSITLATIFAIGFPLGQFAAAYFSDKGGRKIPIIVFSILASIMAILFLFTTGSFYLVAIAGLLVNAFVTARAFIIHPYVAESYPTKLRNTVTGLLNGIARFASSGAQLIVPALFAGFGIGGVYGFIAGLGVIIAIVVSVFGWRSAHRSLEAINEDIK